MRTIRLAALAGGLAAASGQNHKILVAESGAILPIGR